MSHELPPLNWLRAFEAAARLASFTAAARELNMTQPAVSYQIRALEERLGASLFERHARRVEVSDVGRAYLPAVRRAFSQLSASTAGLFGLAGEREVTVRCTATFATLWLAPRLHRFAAANPEVAVRLHTSTWAESAGNDQADVDIRYGDGAWGGYDVALLRRERSVAVCHPAVRERLGAPATPAACAGQPLIHIMGCENFWSHWFATAGLEEPPRRRAIKVDSSLAALEVAASGHGLALVLDAFAGPYLEAGRLVQPVAHTLEGDQAHYLLLPDRQAPPKPEALIFRDWLAAEAGAPVPDVLRPTGS